MKRPQYKFCGRPCYSAYRSRVFRGEGHPTYKGRVKRGWYIGIFRPGHPLASRDGYVLEHRLVVYEAGVAVPPGSHVHHLNHDKTDNRLENLVVLRAGDHHRHHIALTGEVTNQYGTFPVITDPEARRLRSIEHCRRARARKKASL